MNIHYVELTKIWQRPNNMSGKNSYLGKKFSNISAKSNVQRFLNFTRSRWGETHPFSCEEFLSKGVFSVKQGSFDLELNN